MVLEQNADAIDVFRLLFTYWWVEKTEASGQSHLQEFHSSLLSEASRIWSKTGPERDQKVETAG